MELSRAGISQAAIEKAAYSFGLSLASDQIRDIAETESDCLAEYGRISFGRSAAEQIISEFATSPFIAGSDAARAFMELTEAFFELRGDVPARFADIEIVETLREAFDGEAAGDTALATALASEKLSRQQRLSAYEIVDDDGNVYRWDPEEWHDDVMADGWYGERWEGVDE